MHADHTNEGEIDGLTKDVIDQLGAFEDSNDVVMEVCSRTGWDWERAETYVNQTRIRYAGELSRRKNRLLIPVGLAVLVGGAALTYFSGTIIFFELKYQACPQGVLAALLGLLFNHGFLLLLGLGMLAGGAYGIGKALAG
jgi:hypothetical protein